MITKKFKSLIKKIYSIKKESKLYRGSIALKKLSEKEQDSNKKELINILAKKDPEAAASHFLKVFNIEEWIQINISSRDKKNITNYLKSKKSRYYEFLFLLFKLNETDFYENKGKEIEIIKKSLRLFNENNFFKGQVKELENILNKEIPIMDKENLMKTFEENKSEDSKLFDHINNVSSFYLARKFLYPDLVSIYRIHRAREFMIHKKQKNRLSILDYGCGAAYPSLYCGTQGDQCTICDIREILKTAKRRFELRGIDVIPFEATSSTPIINCGENFDIIICDEVIEHMRHPFELLKQLKKSLSPGGLLILGSFPFNPTNTLGDHLKESVDKRKELLEWVYSNLKEIYINDCEKIFTIKPN